MTPMFIFPPMDPVNHSPRDFGVLFRHTLISANIQSQLESWHGRSAAHISAHPKGAGGQQGKGQQATKQEVAGVMVVSVYL